MRRVILSTGAILSLAVSGGDIVDVVNDTTGFENSDVIMSNIDELQERVRVLESQKSEVVTKIVEKSSNESGEKLLKKIEDLEKKIKKLNKKITRLEPMMRLII